MHTQLWVATLVVFKILKLNYFYNKLFGKVHFISFFISSNLIFMPMHFAGIAGHPRRIPDQLNIYYKLHYIESIGGLGIIIS